MYNTYYNDMLSLTIVVTIATELYGIPAW